MTARERVLARRRARVWELRGDGLSIRQIAGRLGVHRSSVARDLLVVEPELRLAPPNHAGPGNDRATKHGAHSPVLVELRARELVPRVLEANVHLDAVRDGAAVFRYAVTLARVERVYAWLSEQGDPVFVDVVAGRAHGVYDRLERWERAADAAESQLAIAPLTRAKLGLDLLQARKSFEDELADGREAWRRREAIDTGEAV